MAGKTKTDLVEDIAQETNLSKTKAKEAVDALLESLSQELSSGSKVTLTGFGTFQVKEQKAKRGRNPQTGEVMEIPAKNVVKFSPGKALRNILA
jgi:DNA-binding protein HU-beta